MNSHDKLKVLKDDISKLGSLVVAFSGGVDSTFLLKVAHDVLADNVIAVTVRASVNPERELREAVDFIRGLGIKHIIIDADVLKIKGFTSNPENRCYICKRAIFDEILGIAKQNNSKYVADGSNIDDLSDYRPGKLALEELGVLSPLKDAGMTKDDIRLLSKEMCLPTWDKPAFACLASRIPYGNEITREKLDMIDKAEQFLMDKGFKQVRVRHHENMARIEVPVAERNKFFDIELMDIVYNKFKEIGFAYAALDLKGYRTGSMNETIEKH